MKVNEKLVIVDYWSSTWTDIGLEALAENRELAKREYVPNLAQELRTLRKLVPALEVVAKESQLLIDTRFWQVFSGVTRLDEALSNLEAVKKELEG